MLLEPSATTRLPQAMAARARRAARGFADAFARYELGHGGARLHDELRRFATPRLAGALLDEPAREPVATRLPPRAAVGGIVLLGPVNERVKALVGLRSAAGRRVLELWLIGGGSGWRVDALQG